MKIGLTVHETIMVHIFLTLSKQINILEPYIWVITNEKRVNFSFWSILLSETCNKNGQVSKNLYWSDDSFHANQFCLSTIQIISMFTYWQIKVLCKEGYIKWNKKFSHKFWINFSLSLIK